MTKRISCSELGVKDCEFTASGETVEDVVEEMVEHLRDTHDMDMPDADAIMTGKVGEGPLESMDDASGLVVQRMIEKLNILPDEESDLPKPTIGRTSN